MCNNLIDELPFSCRNVQYNITISDDSALLRAR